MEGTACYIIGLTGGIASGKTTVSDCFKQLGCPIIDTDIIARNVVKPKSDGLAQLVKVFGKGILDNTDHLNRSKLRQLVFNDEKKLSQLNSILHPMIHKKTLEEINNVPNSYCIVVIPLLCESTQYKWLDRILVVDVSPETQLKRLLQRDNINNELALKMINSQCSRKQRLDIADDVINNEKSIGIISKHVKTLHCLYKSF